jgi:hypothetical protein
MVVASEILDVNIALQKLGEQSRIRATPEQMLRLLLLTSVRFWCNRPCVSTRTRFEMGTGIPQFPQSIGIPAGGVESQGQSSLRQRNIAQTRPMYSTGTRVIVARIGFEYRIAVSQANSPQCKSTDLYSKGNNDLIRLEKLRIRLHSVH